MKYDNDSKFYSIGSEECGCISCVFEKYLKKIQILPLHKNRSFPLRISPVNVDLEGNCGFGHIYWINLQWKTSFFVQFITTDSQVIKNVLRKCNSTRLFTG